MLKRCDECLVLNDTALIKCSDDSLLYVCRGCLATYVEDNYRVVVCHCGSGNIKANQYSPSNKPYVIVTEYDCNDCKAYWYEED